MAEKKRAAPAPEAQERQGTDKTINASDRELLIREYERRLARLKSGGSPGDDETINASDRESLIRQYEKRLEKLKAGASPTNVIL